MTPRLPASLVALSAAALVLAGCASGPQAPESGKPQVVATTNVYGEIAEAIGGDDIEVTSLIRSLTQDPHAYEATARDRLAVSRADLVIANGGGYDAFIDDLAAGTDAEVLTAVDTDDHHDHDHDHAEEEGHEGHSHDGNEHVWYEPHAMAELATEIGEHLAEIDPDNAETYAANTEAFLAGLEEIEQGIDDLAADHAGAGVFVTEPVPVLLLEAAGLENVTPPAFTEAVEEGQDVPPATLLEARSVLESGEVAAVIANAQTGGAETTDVIQRAESLGIPVLEFTELLPDGLSYLEWMQRNVDDLTAALAAGPASTLSR